MEAEIIEFDKDKIQVKCSFCQIKYNSKRSFDGFCSPEGKHQICRNCIEKCTELCKTS